MNDVSYLQSMRQTDAERLAFRVEYGLDNLVLDPFPSPEYMLESHSHHAEYEASRH